MQAVNTISFNFKGIGSILFLKGALKNICKKYKRHFRRTNYEVCTAVARCFPNILDITVLEFTFF
jgi:hypothetical protein